MAKLEAIALFFWGRAELAGYFVRFEEQILSFAS